MRNHELVGQVSLDQLEARAGRMPGYEEEPPSDSEHLSSDRVIVKTEEIVTNCDEIPEENQARYTEENDIVENITLKMEDDTNESLSSGLQDENAKITAMKHELDQQEQAVTGFLPEQRTDDLVDQSICEGKESEDRNSPEKEQSTNEEAAQATSKLSEASITEIHTKENQDGEVERLMEGDSSISTTENMKENSIKTQLTKDLLTLGPNCAQLKVSHVEGSSVSLKEGPVSEQRNSEIRDPYGEMPVLEKECFKKELDSQSCCEEEDQGDHSDVGHTDQEHDEGDGIKDPDQPRVSKGKASLVSLVCVIWSAD